MFRKETILKRDSFVLESDKVKICVTEKGGNMWPAIYDNDLKDGFNPYFISPWQYEDFPMDGSYMDTMRGDFFCLPFGKAPKGAPFHGETCAYPWTLEGVTEEDGVHTLSLSMDVTVPEAHVVKNLSIHDGENAIYVQHRISGLNGSYNFAHHVTMDTNMGRQAYISMSPLHLSYTHANGGGIFTPHEHGYPWVNDIQKVGDDRMVTTIWKDPDKVDVSHVPVVDKFTGHVFNFHKDLGVPAWTCFWFPGENYVFFDLKDPQVCQGTMFWMEGGGRYQHPWNGRVSATGCEDFALIPGNQDPKAEAWIREIPEIKFTEPFEADKTYVINQVQGAVKVPENFGKVKTIDFGDGELTITGESGLSVTAPVDWKHIYTK